MKKAIIFGITGQDGSHLADLLLEKGYHVIGVIRRTSNDSTPRIKHVLDNPSFELIQGDITDAHRVIQILKKHASVDEIYNLAAQSHVAVSFKQPALTWDITGKGCLNILQAMSDLDITQARFYQASSSEMFGSSFDTKLPFADNKGTQSVEKYQDEETKFLPQSPYAIAKCAAHYMTRLFREGYGFHASAGILFNHEGPRRGENFVTRKITKWIGDFVKWKMLHGDEPDLSDLTFSEDDVHIHPKAAGGVFEAKFPKLRLGNLEAFRDWGYAGDYVEAMWLMLQQDVPDDYVICTGETHTIREFLDVAFKCIGINEWENFVVVDKEFYRPAEVDYLRGSNAKAKEQLGWEPKHSFEDLVKLMVDHDTK